MFLELPELAGDLPLHLRVYSAGSRLPSLHVCVSTETFTASDPTENTGQRFTHLPKGKVLLLPVHVSVLIDLQHEILKRSRMRMKSSS